VGAHEFGGDLLVRLLDHVSSVIPGTVGAGVVIRELHRQPGRPKVDGGKGTCLRAAAGVGVAVELDQLQLDCGQGPVWDTLATGQVLALPAPPGERLDLTTWPLLAGSLSVETAARVAAVVVDPGDWGEDQAAALTIYLDAPLPAEQMGEVDRMESLIAHTVAVVEYCAGEEMRAEQMVQMIQYRRVVEQAKGAVMVAVGTDAQGAFQVLSRASQHFNVRLRNLAIALVEHIGHGEAEHPDDPEAVVVPSPEDHAVARQVWAALASGPGTSSPETPGPETPGPGTSAPDTSGLGTSTPDTVEAGADGVATGDG
jgi:hypothetical protein